jgi:hypothetical protein
MARSSAPADVGFRSSHWRPDVLPQMLDKAIAFLMHRNTRSVLFDHLARYPDDWAAAGKTLGSAFGGCIGVGHPFVCLDMKSSAAGTHGPSRSPPA